MKRITRIVFIFYVGAIAVFLAPGNILSKPGQKITDAGNKSIAQVMADAFHQPFKTCRSQKHLRLLSLLEENIYPAHFIVSADSIESLIRPVKDGKNIQKNFILNVLLFALSENNDKAKACTALKNAATIAFYHMKEPQTALRLYKIGERQTCLSAKDSLAVVQKFLKTDLQILRLLNENYVQKNAEGKKEYITLLERELHKHPKARLINEARKRIGDVAFLLHDDHTLLKYYQAVAKKSHYALSPTVLFRMKIAKNILLRKRLWIICDLGYFLALLVLLSRIRRGGGFDLKLFLKRSFLFLLVYLVLGFAIILVDQKLSPGSLLKWLDVQGISPNRPILPLGLLSILPRHLIAQIIVIGFVPVLYALIFVSFRRSFSKILLIVGIIMIMSSSWLHFSLSNIFDEKMNASGFYTGTRFYFRGALDDLIDKNPGALLRAVENAPKEDREKVMEIIRKHEKKAASNNSKSE